MLAHGEGGHIVNTASMAGVLPIPGAAIYITAKAAVIGLSEALRSELAAEGIGVSAFCPGPVQTNIREGGRMRPERYSDSGYTDARAGARGAGRTRRSGWTHVNAASASSRASAATTSTSSPTAIPRGADERFRAMLASFPDEPLDDERADASASCSRTRSSARVLERDPSDRSIGLPDYGRIVDIFVTSGVVSLDRTS